MDEIEAMKAIAEKLEKLSDEERGRVLNWAASKYGLPIGPASPSALTAAPASHSNVVASPKASPASTNGAKSKTSKKAKSIIAMDKSLNLSAVYTFFKTLGWPVPSDLRNTLQQAGTKGWLDTKDSEDIKLTAMGENLVEHTLPLKPKA
jgi:hypothetical protein